MIIDRLRDRKWAIGQLGDWFVLKTPWFVLMFADPDGAVDFRTCYIIRGIYVYYGWNVSRKDGEECWLACKKIEFSRISFQELREAA